MTTPSFTGEVMLAGWSETHAGGAKIVLWLPDADSLTAFRAMTVRKGNTAGQRFMAVLVEIGDDELPVAPPSAPVVQQTCGTVYTGGTKMSRSEWFHKIATAFRDGAEESERPFHDFRQLMAESDAPTENRGELKGIGVPSKPPIGPLCLAAVTVGATKNFCRFVAGDGVASIDNSAHYIRGYCGVESRRELDTNADAGRKFHRLMSNFRKWQLPGETPLA